LPTSPRNPTEPHRAASSHQPQQQPLPAISPVAQPSSPDACRSRQPVAQTPDAQQRVAQPVAQRQRVRAPAPFVPARPCRQRPSARLSPSAPACPAAPSRAQSARPSCTSGLPTCRREPVLPKLLGPRPCTFSVGNSRASTLLDPKLIGCCYLIRIFLLNA